MNTVRLLLVALLLLVPTHAYAALAIDSQMPTNTGIQSTANSPFTVSFTNTAGTLILVGVSFGNTQATTITGVKYNNVAMTSGCTVGYDGATHNFAGAYIWYLLLPATGANNIEVTYTGANGGGTSWEVGAISFSGNDTSTPIVASSCKTAFSESAVTSAAVTSATSTTGNYVVAQMATGTAYSSTTQSRTWSLNASTASAGGAGAMTYASGTGGTIAMTDQITSDEFGMVCLEVAAAAGGGGGPAGCKNGLLMQGVGCEVAP